MLHALHSVAWSVAQSALVSASPFAHTHAFAVQLLRPSPPVRWYPPSQLTHSFAPSVLHASPVSGAPKTHSHVFGGAGVGADGLLDGDELGLVTSSPYGSGSYGVSSEGTA